jgi:hypothetical protein
LWNLNPQTIASLFSFALAIAKLLLCLQIYSRLEAFQVFIIISSNLPHGINNTNSRTSFRKKLLSACQIKVQMIIKPGNEYLKKSKPPVFLFPTHLYPV